MCATNHRNNIWNREGTLWQDTIKKSPLKARPYNSLGIHYMEEKKCKYEDKQCEDCGFCRLDKYVGYLDNIESRAEMADPEG